MVRNINLLESRRRILLNTPHIETVSDTIASFKTDVATKLKECKIHFTPIQEGEGDPSPENVRPITGWDGVTVYRAGKNLLDTSQLRTGYYIDANGNEIANRQFGYTTAYTPVKENTVYTISGNIGNHGVAFGAIYCYNKNKELIDRLGGYKTTELPHTFTTPEGTAYVNIQYAVFNNAPQNVQIELGSTATTYEPYKPITTITIPFPQTIYGGYVDLVKGEVVEEWKEYVYPNKTNVFNDLGNGYYKVGFGDVHGKGYGSASNSMCSKLSYGYKTSGTLKIGYELDYVLLNQSNRFHTLVHSETPLTADTARQWFIDNNIQLVREVYSPTVYQIDPQTLKALRGMNNIWSDANGNIEVSFYTH